MAWTEREGRTELYATTTLVTDDSIADAFKNATIHAIDEFKERDGFDEYLEGAIEHVATGILPYLDEFDNDLYDTAYSLLTDYFTANPPEEIKE